MKVLFVNPRFPNTFWGMNFLSKFIPVKTLSTPLWAPTVSSIISKIFPSWERRLTDMNVERLRKKDILWANMVCISFSMLIQDRKEIQAIIDWCKRLGKIVVGGGEGFTTLYKEFQNVDHFVLGEGEVTIPLFLKDFKKGEAKKIYYSSKKADLKDSPTPDWSLIKFKKYASVLIQTSRGCPFDCEFCDVTARFGKDMRLKSITQIITELDALNEMGFCGGVFFADDNFIGNIVRTKKLLKAILLWQEKNNYPFSFFTQVSINLAKNRDLMELMSEAEFRGVFIGVESPNKEALRECGKKQNSVDQKEALRIIQSYGLETMIGLIIGFDEDDRNIFKTMLEFVQKTRSPAAMLGLLNAYPGTELRNRLKKENRLVDETSGNNTDGTINFRPLLMSRDELINGFREIAKKIYSPKWFSKRVDDFCLKLKLKKKRKKINLRTIRINFNAVLNASWRIGVFSKFRFVYWRSLFKVLFYNRTALPSTIQIYIAGFCRYHLIKNSIQ